MSDGDLAAPRDCLILGAGFSFGFSDRSPLMSNFFDMALQLSEKEESTRKVLTRVASFFPASAHPNLEDAASFLFMRKSTGATKRNDDLSFRRIVAIIVAVLSDVHRQPRSEAIRKDFKRFFDVLVRDRTPIISFNYDLIAERFLVKTGEWRGTDGYGVGMQVIGTRDTDRKPFWSQGGISKLGLFKLHGSINWGVRNFPDAEGGRPVEVGFDLSDESKPIPVSSFKAANETIYRVGAKWEPLIVPPVAVKSEFLSAGPLESIWYQAQHAISGAERIFLIGYSCPQTDSHVDALIREALFGEEDSRKTLYVVNPSLGDYKKFNQRYGKNSKVKLKYLETSAENYVRKCAEAKELVTS